MAGIGEEGAKVATSIVETMKSHPMTLALVIFNLLFAILVFLGSKDFRANQLKLMSMMIEMTSKSQDLLSKCITPDRQGGYIIPQPEQHAVVPEMVVVQPASNGASLAALSVAASLPVVTSFDESVIVASFPFA